jgi:hypothetical protein
MKAATRRDSKRNARAIVLFRQRKCLSDKMSVPERSGSMSNIVGRSERHFRLVSDSGAPLAFRVAPSRQAPQPKAVGKPPIIVRNDGVDHTELPTLQNLGNAPPHLALVPLFFNNLQRYVGPMFSPENAGHYLQMGPYTICGADRWVNGVKYALEDGSTYGIVRDPTGRLFLTFGDKMIPFDKGSPAEQHRAVEMLRQAGVSAYVSALSASRSRTTNR